MYRLVILALVQSVFLTAGQIVLKKALLAAGEFSWTWKFFQAQFTNWWFLLCGIVFTVAGVLWLYLLRNFPFSIVYPLSCVSYALGVLAAVVLFHEQVSWVQWLGVIMIMGGCVLVVR